jgi:hypothetical protein
MRNFLRIAVVVALLVTPAIAFAGSRQVRAINCAREQYKPRTIFLTCADDDIFVHELKWAHWSRTKAVASGTFTWDDCKPDCADGHFRSLPVRVTLTGPKQCPGRVHRAFGHGVFTYPAGAPPFQGRRWTFSCP